MLRKFWRLRLNASKGNGALKETENEDEDKGVSAGILRSAWTRSYGLGRRLYD
jgi:hypothetical protein